MRGQYHNSPAIPTIIFGRLCRIVRAEQPRATSIRARRMLAGVAKDSSQVHDAGPIESQLFDSRSASRRQAVDEKKVIGPRKMFRPVVLTRMKQSCGAAREGINCIEGNKFGVVASLAGEREVRQFVGTSSRLRDNVLHRKRVGGKLELAPTILAAIPRTFGDRLPNVRIGGHFKSRAEAQCPTGRAIPVTCRPANGIAP